MSMLTRRDVGRLALVVPLAALLPGAARSEEEPPPLLRFLADHEPELSAEERARLLKNLTSLEANLVTVRKFPLTNAVAPAARFRALRLGNR